MRRMVVLAIAVAVAVAFFGAVQAMPRSDQLDQLKTVIDTNTSLVQKVHGLSSRLPQRASMGVASPRRASLHLGSMLGRRSTRGFGSTLKTGGGAGPP